MLITPSCNTTIDNFLSLIIISHVTKDTTISRYDYDDAKTAMEDITQACTVLGNPDLGTNASPIHTAEFFGIVLPEDSLWQYLTDISIKEEIEACKLNDISLDDVEIIQDIINPMLKTWDLILSKGTVNTNIFIDISTYLSNQDFNLGILHLVSINHIMQKAYPNEFEEALKQSAQERQKRISNEVLFEDDRVLITIQDVMIADIPQNLLTKDYYKGNNMEMIPTVLVLNKITGKVQQYPLEGS